VRCPLTPVSTCAGLALALLASVAPSGAAAAKPRNFLLLTVDTLRADHLGAYGFAQPVSPNIDALAKRGVLFEDALTTIGKTCPAFSSLFTSLFPPTHGARRNGVKMRDDVPLLTEILRRSGYATAAFISNWTLRDRLCGLARGFDHYDEEFTSKRYAVKGAEKGAPEINEAVLGWLRENRRPAAEGSEHGPLFLWVHYSDPHAPYEQHPGYTTSPPQPGERRDGWQKRWRYASEVRWVDHWIGKLLEELAPYLPAEETYILFLSDHGESLGEHDYWGHGRNTYWPNLDIPLLLTGPEVPAGSRVSSPVSIVDLLPTVLELLAVDTRPEDVEGVSFAGAWRQPTVPPERARFSIGERRTVLGKKGRENYDDPLMIALQTTAAKTVFDFDAQRLVYYDLAVDPLEQHPLTEPPVRSKPPLRRQLANWYRELPKYQSRTESELLPEDVEKLRALGYIGD
jgi:arylsulfatase A-like enzyme